MQGDRCDRSPKTTSVFPRIKRRRDRSGNCFELAVHCAAEVSLDEAACRAANVDGLRNLVAALGARPPERLVHISTVSVYDWRRGTDFDEESPQWTESLDPYGFTKAARPHVLFINTAHSSRRSRAGSSGQARQQQQRLQRDQPAATTQRSTE
jgi:nucleoside-diphosphate-sugar epimerase